MAGGALFVGYARCSTDQQDSTAQRDALLGLGVQADQIYVDHRLTDAVGRLLFNVLAMVAEFESDLIRLGAREGMEVVRAKGRLRGKHPKLNRRQEAHLVSLVHSGECSTPEVAEVFGAGRPHPTALRDAGATDSHTSVSTTRKVPVGATCGGSAASCPKRRSVTSCRRFASSLPLGGPR